MAIKTEVALDYSPVASTNPDRPKIKHLVIPLSKANRTNADGTVLSIPDADRFVGSFIELGYRLISTHYLGESPEYYSMIYVLSM